MIPKIAPWKEGRVAELSEILNKPGVIGFIDVAGVPATNMLDMRSNLRDKTTMTMAKKTLVRRAWNDSQLGNEDLEVLLEGVTQPMLIHSDSLNAFQLFNELQKTRQGRAAKEGDVAPIDIVIEKGPTTFGPGPIVGEFNAVGIPAKIEKGKVAISKRTVVVEAGEVIEGELGMMLAKLDIHPIEIGLILSGVIEDGTLMAAAALDIDVDDIRDNFGIATSQAFNVACNIVWFSSATMPALLAKASGEALAVAVAAGVSNSETIPMFIGRANARAMAIASQLDSSALDEELAEMLGASAATAAAVSTAAPDAPAEVANEEEEEEEENAGFEGLGNLFG